MQKRKEFKEENIQFIMAKKRQEGILLLYGWLFIILGIFSLFLHYIIKINLVMGNVLIDTNNTGIFLLVIGILSVLLHYLSK